LVPIIGSGWFRHEEIIDHKLNSCIEGTVIGRIGPKMGVLSLGGSGKYLPFVEGWNTAGHDCRYLTLKRKQKAG
jgi:hypothetical protein